MTTLPGKFTIEQRVILDEANLDLISAIEDCCRCISEFPGGAAACAAWIISQVACSPEISEYVDEWIKESHG